MMMTMTIAMSIVSHAPFSSCLFFHSIFFLLYTAQFLERVVGGLTIDINTQKQPNKTRRKDVRVRLCVLYVPHIKKYPSKSPSFFIPNNFVCEASQLFYFPSSSSLSPSQTLPTVTAAASYRPIQNA
jgi:hypothetical protein